MVFVHSKETPRKWNIPYISAYCAYTFADTLKQSSFPSALLPKLELKLPSIAAMPTNGPDTAIQPAGAHPGYHDGGLGGFGGAERSENEPEI